MTEQCEVGEGVLTPGGTGLHLMEDWELIQHSLSVLGMMASCPIYTIFTGAFDKLSLPSSSPTDALVRDLT